MRFSLVLFIIAISLIIIGYTKQVSNNQCKNEVIVKYVSRNVYDELVNS